MHKIKQMIKYIATLLLTVLFVACNNGKGQQPSEENEDPKAKEILQGIWLDDETETPLMRIIGDTIYYSDAQSAPVYFKIEPGESFCGTYTLWNRQQNDMMIREKVRIAKTILEIMECTGPDLICSKEAPADLHIPIAE